MCVYEEQQTLRSWFPKPDMDLLHTADMNATSYGNAVLISALKPKFKGICPIFIDLVYELNMNTWYFLLYASDRVKFSECGIDVK
jgi:hypothetical protein